VPGAKLWNEELVPFAVLVDGLRASAQDKFRISPESHPGPHLYLVREGQETGVQVTIADAEWGGKKLAERRIRWQYECLARNEIDGAVEGRADPQIALIQSFGVTSSA
jgi:hypothetical protein